MNRQYNFSIPSDLRSWYVMWRAVVVFCLIALICLHIHDWWEGSPPRDISRIGAILLFAALLFDSIISVVEVWLDSEELKTRVIDLIEEDDIQVVDFVSNSGSMSEEYTITLMRHRWIEPVERDDERWRGS